MISLKDCYVTLWPPNLTEGTLFTKKTSILIIKKSLYDPDTNTFKLATKIEHFINNNVFFLQFENNYDKEDWFFAILQSQKHAYEKEVSINAAPVSSGFIDGLGHFFDNPPPTFHFQTKDVAKLIALNNADTNHINCKWFNLVLSRIFMASKANDKIENAIKEKINEKLSKVNVSFLDEIVINDLKLGNIPPLLSNPKVVKMDLEGDLEVHFDILFDSHFTLNISTSINILNKNYPIELKLHVKKLKGAIILIFKKPPSNRLWYTFKSVPSLDMEIDPVIVNKSVSYGKILKTLKNRILDAFKEVLVYPNFEDVNYYKMSEEHKDNFYKGGLWDFTGFDEAFASNETKSADVSTNGESVKEEIVSEEIILTNLTKENDESEVDKGSVLSTGISAFSSDNDQPKNGLKERKTFKDLLKRKTLSNENSTESDEINLESQDVYSNNSNDSSGTNKVSSKFSTFYQKAKKSASTMIDNMKPESETDLNDENEESGEAPVETDEHHFENQFDQIPKLPKRRPLPPVPTSVIAETLNNEAAREETVAPATRKLPPIPKVEKLEQDIETHQTEIDVPQEAVPNVNVTSTEE